MSRPAAAGRCRGALRRRMHQRPRGLRVVAAFAAFSDYDGVFHTVAGFITVFVIRHLLA